MFIITQQLNAQTSSFIKTDDIAALEKKHFQHKYLAKTVSLASNNYEIFFSRCFWKVNPSVRYIDGLVTHHFKILNATNSISFDLTTQLTVDSVLYHQQKINFSQQSNQTLSINFSAVINQNQKDSVSIYYHGVPDNTGFGSFIQSTHNGVPVVWTLSEPYGAKDWFPCRNGVDDKTDSIDIFITHPSTYKATANGMLQYEKNDGVNTTTFYKHRYPIATYLIAFSVTNFSVFTHTVQLGNVTLPMISYIYPENVADFQNNTYMVLDALKLFHHTFGDYPFIKEKYGHTQFGWGGGMEHQTNTFLVLPDNNLMAHELAHQWFGNKITCGSWQDIWLNESFATFAANYYLEKFDTARFRSILITHLSNIVSQSGGSVFCKDTTDPNRIFNGRLSYDKGGYVLRMLRFTLGDSLFFKGLKAYINDTTLQYNFAKTTDFKRIMEKTCNKDLTYFFNQWIYGEGHPNFIVNWVQNKNNWAKVNVQQITSHSSVSFFKTPLPLTFKNATQQKTVVVQCNNNTDETWVNIGFVADTVLVDVEMQLISNINKTQKMTAASLIKDDIKIYPNPIKNNLFVSIKNPSFQNLNIQLFSLQGQKMIEKKITLSGADEIINIPTTHFAKGTYLLKISNNENSLMTKKLIVF